MELDKFIGEEITAFEEMFGFTHYVETKGLFLTGRKGI